MIFTLISILFMIIESPRSVLSIYLDSISGLSDLLQLKRKAVLAGYK